MTRRGLRKATVTLRGPEGTLTIPVELLPTDPAEEARFLHDLTDALSQPVSGLERVLEDIRRDRGLYAPSGPVTLCGVPDGTEKTVAEWDREYRRRQPRTPWGKWRRRRECFHHDRLTGQSWIEDRLINMGSQKMFWCTECGRTWFT